MYFLYVDESGDSELLNSPPPYYFVLTGLVIHELRWQQYLEQMINFRRRMKTSFNLPVRSEIHSAQMIRRPGALITIPRNDRASILRYFARELAQMNDLNVINIVVDKRHKTPPYDVTTNAWTALLQRFSNTISHRNFKGPTNPDERGMVIPDMSEVKKITGIMRRMRHYNPVPNQQSYGGGYRNLTVSNVVEDPFFKDSAESHFIQAADLCAYLLYQSMCPASYARKMGIKNYFKILNPVLCKIASSTDPDGIVRL